MARYTEELRDLIDYHAFVQYCFDTQWQALRTYAHEQGAIAKTRFSYEKHRRKLVLNVDAVEGEYEGMHASRTYEVKMTLDRKPRRVKVEGKKVKDVVWDKARKTATFCAEHPDTAQPLEIKIKL